MLEGRGEEEWYGRGGDKRGDCREVDQDHEVALGLYFINS